MLIITAKSLMTIAIRVGDQDVVKEILTSIKEATDFLKSNFNITMMIDREIRCEFNDYNKECLMHRCPYYPNN